MTFKTNTIARSGIAISDLGLGCASLAGLFAPVSERDARGVVDHARQAGITYFDTAPFYGLGRSERIVGDQLRGQSYVLSTKVGRLLRPDAAADHSAWVQGLPFTPVLDYSYDGILRSFEDSLQRLGLDRIDILYIHDIGNLTHGVEHGPALFKRAMTDGYRALEKLRGEGRIKAIGLGVNEVAACLEALDYGSWDVFLLAGRYTLLEQSPLDELFPKATKAGVDIVCGGPFNSGVLAGGATFDYGNIPPAVSRRVAEIRSVCLSHDVPLPAAALQFVKAHPLVKSTIPGPRNTKELADVISYWRCRIPNGFWEELKTRHLLRADAPVPAEQITHAD